jgi:hypothetical protein
MSQQETATDRLVGVIQSIQVEQGSGVLIVRRGEGGTLEEGTVIFVNGQMTQATIGRRSNKDALNWLSTWEQCRYIFLPSGATRERPETPVERNTPPPILSNLSGNSRPQVTDALPRVPISPLRKQPKSAEIVPSSQRGPLMDEENQVPPLPIFSLDEALRRIERGKLTRSHRQLFLLVDGQRSPLELARLIGKSRGEAYELLRDLERAGVISLGGK